MINRNGNALWRKFRILCHFWQSHKSYQCLAIIYSKGSCTYSTFPFPGCQASLQRVLEALYGEWDRQCHRQASQEYVYLESCSCVTPVHSWSALIPCVIHLGQNVECCSTTLHKKVNLKVSGITLFSEKWMHQVCNVIFHWKKTLLTWSCIFQIFTLPSQLEDAWGSMDTHDQNYDIYRKDSSWWLLWRIHLQNHWRAKNLKIITVHPMVQYHHVMEIRLFWNVLVLYKSILWAPISHHLYLPHSYPALPYQIVGLIYMVGRHEKFV